MPTSSTYRILIADDTPALHESYRNIFAPPGDCPASFPGAEEFLGATATDLPASVSPVFELTFVFQGEEALSAIATAQAAGTPFALAILDIRMPPGIDGVQTALRLRAEYPDLQILLCTAYADYTWADLAAAFPDSDSVLLLKKPFDAIEVLQIAHALCRKWELALENQALIRDLESRVAARTAQLARTTEELAVALRAAQAADRAKHAFLRSVSHELNTPLNGIQGAASILAGSSHPETKQLGQVIHDSGARLNRLFTRILLYLQLEADTPLKLSRLQPVPVLLSCFESHIPDAEAKRLNLLITLEAPMELFMVARADLIAALLDNLLENAIKFTPEGTVRVTLAHDPAAERFVIKVEDTGMGLASDEIDEFTALFKLGDDSLTRRQDGIGIGLALVARINRHFGGTLTVCPGPDSGTVFTISLPCASLSQAAQQTKP
ncbi:MAG: hybrid sensor histidine kinase/response regulator [Verrucomicrobia bacterium]|nr:hybrid sensor histidine kinase/response regulator [Verrucomicrobiota bacterium]